MKTTLISAISILLITTTAHSAQTIDFETLPSGGAPFDGMVVSNQWQTLGVTFRFGNGNFPILATPHGTNFAFWYPNYIYTNLPAPGENVGRFFLTDRASGQPPNLIIDYTTPVRAASGVIIDIDHEDAWTIEPRDINANVISNAVVHLSTTNANAGDGIATPWSLATTSAIIHSIRIRFTGTSPTPGLAFDNFSPTNALPAPAPARLGLHMQPTTVSLTITGTPSALYKIQRATTLPTTNWTTLTNIYLPSSSFTVFDQRATNTAARIYRAVGIQ